jgi:uncharacterized protein YchJ
MVETTRNYGNGLIVSESFVGFPTAEFDFECDKRQKAVEDDVKEGRVKSATVRRHFNIQRNDQCPCGSGKKFKKCCLRAVAQDN